jgi:multidrug efflux pump subunit AcrA (membrane-fusion protein)
VQEGLGGKAKAIWLCILAGLAALISALWFIPYPLKMEGNGTLVPWARRVVYSPVTGTVRHFDVSPAEPVAEYRTLVQMFDVQLENKILTLKGEIDRANLEAREFEQKMTDRSLSENERLRLRADVVQRKETALSKARELQALLDRTNAERERGREGIFYLKAPQFTNEEALKLSRREWTVLNANFKEELTNREVKPSDPILRLGAKDGPWEIELKIPQKHIGQVLAAFERLKQAGKPEELEVDLLLRNDPTRTFKGKLPRSKMAGEAVPNQQESGEAEPVVTAIVTLDDIDPAYRVPPALLLSGTEVHAKVRCGNHRLGYAMFYGVWEFICEKILFWF